jgi:hypothetical protein
MLTVVTDDDVRADAAATALDEIVREGARRMLIATLEAEVAGYIDALAGELDEHGHRLVVRNGHAEGRTITTAAGGSRFKRHFGNERGVGHPRRGTGALRA